MVKPLYLPVSPQLFHLDSQNMSVGSWPTTFAFVYSLAHSVLYIYVFILS